MIKALLPVFYYPAGGALDAAGNLYIADVFNNMEEELKKAKRNSLLVSALYVGLGTVAVLCSYPPYYGDWVLLILLFTLPVSILGFGVMSAGQEYYVIVIVIQLIMFFIAWRILYNYLLKKYN